MYSQFADTFPDRPNVTGVAKRQSVDPGRNFASGTAVTKSRHPVRESWCFTNLNHRGVYLMGYMMSSFDFKPNCAWLNSRMHKTKPSITLELSISPYPTSSATRPMNTLARLDSFLLAQVYEPIKSCRNRQLRNSPYKPAPGFAWNVILPFVSTEGIELFPCVKICCLQPAEIFLRFVNWYLLPFVNHQLSEFALLKIAGLKCTRLVLQSRIDSPIGEVFLCPFGQPRHRAESAVSDRGRSLPLDIAPVEQR